MNQPGHLLGAPVCVLGGGLLAMKIGIGLDAGELMACAFVSIPTAGGWFSPDCDQRAPFKSLGHRYTTHWWGFPIMVICVLAYFGAPLVLFGPAFGWLSHIWPWDWLFGKGGRDIPKGIPRGPWSKKINKRSRRKGKRWGVGLKVTGANGRRHSVLELTTTCAFVPVLAWELAVIGGMVS